jgi:hypothetical protein
LRRFYCFSDSFDYRSRNIINAADMAAKNKWSKL